MVRWGQCRSAMAAVVVSPVAACPAAAFRRAVVRPTARAAPFLGGAPIRMLKHAAARGGSITIASKASNRGRHVVAVQSLAVIASGAARDDRDPRDSPIARIAAGSIDSSAPGGSHRRRTEDAEDAVGSPPGGLAILSVGDTLDAWLRRAWAARKMVAGVALAVVLALCDAAPAVAKGRGGGGRSGGRMGGSSFRPSGTSSRSMVSEDATGPCGVPMGPVISRVSPLLCEKRRGVRREEARGRVVRFRKHVDVC